MLRNGLVMMLAFGLLLGPARADDEAPKARYRTLPSARELMIHDQEENWIYVLGGGQELSIINLKTGEKLRKALSEVPFVKGPEKGEKLELVSVEEGRKWFLFNPQSARIYILKDGNKGMVVLDPVAATASEKTLVESLDPASSDKIKKAEAMGNEASAIGCLKTLVSAQAIFNEGDRDGNGKFDYGSLKQLGAANFIDERLASGEKSGYTFRCEPGTKSPEFTFWALAIPKAPGGRYFYVNQTGVVFEREAEIEVDPETAEAKGDLKPLGAR